MTTISTSLLDVIQFDLDHREETIRRIVFDELAQLPEPDLSEHLVATYFVWAHDLTLAQVGNEITYHMTSGIRKAAKGSLLDQCTGRVIDSVCFDAQQRCGLVRVAFPLKMLRDEEGKIYSTDILHIVGGAGIFALRENRDAKLVDVALSGTVLETFPGPAYGVEGLRTLTRFDDRIAWGTILKPCTGITAEEEADIVFQAASNPLFMFIKEDENFLPGVEFAPLRVRAGACREAVKKAQSLRGESKVIFAMHVTAPPHRIGDYVNEALEAGAGGVMFSEYYIGGAVRMVREMTRSMAQPPVIYGHNGGIDTMTHAIYREVLDLLARLDGVDIRQTAPVTTGRGLLRPYGREWRNVEQILTKPLAGKAPVMIARAGGLDQGNIIPNLLDIEQSGLSIQNYLFLAGSAINGIKNSAGRYDSQLGAAAMEEAMALYSRKVFTTMEQCHVAAMKKAAREYKYAALSAALDQRYPQEK